MAVIDQIGRYRIAGELGRGAMGVVYRAEDPAIGRTVAIKTIRLTDVTDPRERQRLRERLVREAQSAGILSHPGIVTIYDIAEENGLCYIFMEFVNGRSLEKMIAGGSLPDPAALVEIFRQTAAALDHAHKNGIVHRDVKPANIMVDESGAVKVTDFGVSRFVSHEMTQTGGLLGTPSYMSPEQIQGHPVGGQADQFALAVIVYEALTGEKPFVADSLPALIYRIVRDEPAAAHRINQTLNGGVDGVLHKALSKDPAQRFATCTDFIHALAAALASARGWKPIIPGAAASMPTVAMPAPPPIVPAPPPLLPRELPDIQVKRTGGSLGKGLVVGALSGVCVLALLFVVPKFLGNGSGARSESVKTPPQASEHVQAPPAAEETKPSAMGPPVAPKTEETSGPPPSTAAQQPPPEQAQTDGEPDPEPEPVRPPPAAPAPVQEVAPAPRLLASYPVRILADPLGSQVVVDKDSSLSCSSPCTLNLRPGRHTLVARHSGYHDALKIFEVPRNTEVQFGLSQLAGQLIVRTSPDGASIYLNGKLQPRTTPAVLTVPAGRYRLTLQREGYPRQEDDLEIRDGAISNYEFNWVR